MEQLNVFDYLLAAKDSPTVIIALIFIIFLIMGYGITSLVFKNTRYDKKLEAEKWEKEQELLEKRIEAEVNSKNATTKMHEALTASLTGLSKDVDYLKFVAINKLEEHKKEICEVKENVEKIDKKVGEIEDCLFTLTKEEKRNVFRKGGSAV